MVWGGSELQHGADGVCGAAITQQLCLSQRKRYKQTQPMCLSRLAEVGSLFWSLFVKVNT